MKETDTKVEAIPRRYTPSRNSNTISHVGMGGVGSIPVSHTAAVHVKEVLCLILALFTAIMAAQQSPDRCHSGSLSCSVAFRDTSHVQGFRSEDTHFISS